VPAVSGADGRLEGEQVKFALEDVEELLGPRVDVRPDVEAGLDIGFEHRPAVRFPGSHLEGHAGAFDPVTRPGRQDESVAHAALLLRDLGLDPR
jgi:hypothetical protein